MRTQAEIVKRIADRKHGDPLGFEISDYIICLDHEHAMPFLREGVTQQQWDESRPGDLSDGAIRAKMIKYMPFAWNKANNCRGISANRSIMHYIAWAWLIGADELVAYLDDWDTYNHYGKEKLIRICEFLGVDSSQWDDGVREN